MYFFRFQYIFCSLMIYFFWYYFLFLFFLFLFCFLSHACVFISFPFHMSHTYPVFFTFSFFPLSPSFLPFFFDYFLLPLPFSPSLFLSLPPSLPPSLHPSIHLSINPSIHVYFIPSIRSSIYPSFLFYNVHFYSSLSLHLLLLSHDSVSNYLPSSPHLSLFLPLPTIPPSL